MVPFLDFKIYIGLEEAHAIYSVFCRWLFLSALRPPTSDPNWLSCCKCGCINTCLYILTYTAHGHTHIYTYTYTYVYLHTHTQMHKHTHTNVYINTYIRTYIHMYICIFVYMHICIYLHTHTLFTELCFVPCLYIVRSNLFNIFLKPSGQNLCDSMLIWWGQGSEGSQMVTDRLTNKTISFKQPRQEGNVTPFHKQPDFCKACNYHMQLCRETTARKT